MTIDIKYNDIGDIDLSSGDTRLVDAAEQHKMTIILSAKGEIKHRPDIGVGIGQYLLDNRPADLLREVRRNCQRAGMKIREVFFEHGKLKINGGYE